MNTPSLYMDLQEVLHSTTLSQGTWFAMVNNDQAPKPRQLSKGRVGWLRREIEEWCECRPVSTCLPPVNAGRGRSRKQPSNSALAA